MTPRSELEDESIDYFVSFVQIFGLPRSIGQIYGLLFVSKEPLAMDAVVQRLEISKGSASQGLNTLRELGAIRPIKVEGDRREHFAAELHVGKIVNHFFDERLVPRLDHGEERLARMIAMVDDSEDEFETRCRLNALQKWQGRGRKTIPLIKRFLRHTE